MAKSKPDALRGYKPRAEVWQRPRCECREVYRGTDGLCERCRLSRVAFRHKQAFSWHEAGCCTECGRSMDVMDLGAGYCTCEVCRKIGPGRLPSDKAGVPRLD